MELQLDDETLVEQVRRGEVSAFDVLARRHRGWLISLCLPMLSGDHHQAEDVAQECLIRLHATLERDTRELRVRPWLAVVARHLCIDYARRRRPQPSDALPETAVLDEDPFDVDPALAKAWSRLSPRHREALTHRELVGLSYDEIALVMDTSVSAVQTLLFRARASLRTQYRKAGGRLLGCGAFMLGLDRLARGADADPRAVAHVGACSSCGDAVRGIDAIAQLLRGLPAPPARPGSLLYLWERVAHHASGLMNALTPYSGQVATAVTAVAVVVSPAAAGGQATASRSAPPAVVAQVRTVAAPVATPLTSARGRSIANTLTPAPSTAPLHWQGSSRGQRVAPSTWSPRPMPTWSPRPAPTWSPRPAPTWSPRPAPTWTSWPGAPETSPSATS